MSELTAGIKKFWTDDSENNSLFKVYKEELGAPENWVNIKVPPLNDDILKNKNIHYYKKRNDKTWKNMQICSSFSHKPVLL